jgi:Holliday junction resolvasome RuvABC DNA-binding subunit
MTYAQRVEKVFGSPYVGQGISTLELIQKQYLKQAQSINAPIAKKILLEVENEVILSDLEAGTLSAESQNKIGQSLSKMERRTLENKFLNLGFTKKEISSFLN